MEVDRAHTKKDKEQHYKTVLRMEPPRKMKERQTKELMTQRYYLRAAGHKDNMGRGKEESPRQDEVEKICGFPMSPMG